MIQASPFDLSAVYANHRFLCIERIAARPLEDRPLELLG
jgi:hypothetical protein